MCGVSRGNSAASCRAYVNCKVSMGNAAVPEAPERSLWIFVFSCDGESVAGGQVMVYGL